MTKKMKELLLRVAKVGTLYTLYLMITPLVASFFRSQLSQYSISSFWTNRLYAASVYVYSFLILFSLISIFVLHDYPYRLRFLSEEKNLSSFKKKFVFSLRSKEMWIDIGVLCLIMTLLPTIPYLLLKNGFLQNVIKIFHFPIYLAISYFSAFILSITAYNATLSWWARPKQMHKSRSRKTDAISCARQVLASIPLYFANAFALPYVIPTFWSISLILKLIFVNFSFLVILIIIALISSKYIRALHQRRLLIKDMRSALSNGYCELVKTENIYRSIFSARSDVNIILRRGTQNYYCKIITPWRKRDIMLFDEHGKVKFVKDMVVANYYREEDYFFDAEENAKKIIIINPGALKIYATDDLYNRELHSGDKTMGYYVYRSENFVNAIERKYL